MIDTHVHVFPDEVLWRLYAWIEKKHKSKATVQLDADSVLEKLRSMGVGHFFNLTHSITPEMTKPLAEWNAELKKRLNCHVFTGFHQDNGTEELYRIFELGIDGLKLHPPVQRLYPDSREALEIYEVLDELGKPLVIHTGYFLDNGFKYTLPEFYETLAYSYSFPVILAHMMVGKTEHLPRFLDARSNIYSDTSLAFIRVEIPDPRSGEKVRFYSDEVREAVMQYPDRILYGSEIPVIWVDPDETLRTLNQEFDEDTVIQITRKNPEKFIRKYLE
ncbi:amidohydrolase family protein [Geoglobus acetivorans]|uniref:Amidohydrolase 2 n=1 Tax=Geoglobus acetivorans TaxID=565033 RepID=A0A0A7GFY1_GEOAI|nr:amidohydrolase 2 [Geoglobus acetivorans]